MRESGRRPQERPLPAAAIVLPVLAVPVAIVIGIVVWKLSSGGPPYRVSETAACIRGSGRPVRHSSEGGLRRLDIGPFNAGAPGEPTAVLYFAPTAEDAKDAWRDSEPPERRRNVLLVGDVDDGIRNCLRTSPDSSG